MTIYNDRVIQTSISHFWTSIRVGTSNMSNMKLYNYIIKNAATKTREGYIFFKF